MHCVFIPTAKAADWTVAPGDAVFLGDCYQLDFSARVQPGQEWTLSIMLQEDRNTTENYVPTPGDAGYMVVFGHDEDFFVGLTFDHNDQPSHKSLDVGKFYGFMVTPQVRFFYYNTTASPFYKCNLADNQIHVRLQ